VTGDFRASAPRELDCGDIVAIEDGVLWSIGMDPKTRSHKKIKRVVRPMFGRTFATYASARLNNDTSHVLRGGSTGLSADW